MILLVALLVVAVVALVSIEGAVNQPSPPVAWETASTNGVLFRVTLNASRISASQRLNVTMMLYNTSPKLNWIPEGNNWTFQGFPVAFWNGCVVQIPVEFVVVKGNYNSDNLESMATNSSVGYACTEPFKVDHVVFQPSSDVAGATGTVGGIGPNRTAGPFRMLTNLTVSGYWDYPINYTESQDLLTPAKGGGTTFAYPEVSPIPAHRFAAGVYTLLAEDEWEQVLILHFVVE